MSDSRRARRGAGPIVLCLLVLPITDSQAQDTAAAPPDTAAAAQDSLPGPSTRPTVPIADPEVPPGPLAPGNRYVFTRDSLLWSGAVTLADLLSEIPGVYVARSGFLGLPRYIQYGGRGGAALEVSWDGMPMEPLGGDSLFIDPADVPLTYLRRVEVETLPAALRVYLVTERHEGLDPRSKIGVLSGSFDTATFAAMFQKRWSSGLGIDLAADFLGTDGASGENRGDQLFDIWAKLSWLPTETAGAAWQVRRHKLERDPVAVAAGVGIPERRGARTDFLLTLFAGTEPGGLGLRAEAGLAASGWGPDSGAVAPEQDLRQAYLGLSYRRPSWTAAVRGRLADVRTTGELEGRVGWVPVTGVTVTGTARWQRHEGDRTSARAHVAASLQRGPFALIGELAWQDAVQAPALRADTAIETVDRGVRLGISAGFLDGEVGVVRRDAFQPIAYPELPILPALGPSPAATYLVANAELRPSGAVTLAGWYADPMDGAVAALQPPTHGRVELVFRSKFWRTFRSGAFDIKLKVGMESWSRGTAGIDAQGAPIALPGATFFETLVKFQIVRFTGFWRFQNILRTTADFVPGLEYPVEIQTFGVSWEFFQ